MLTIKIIINYSIIHFTYLLMKFKWLNDNRLFVQLVFLIKL